MPSRHLHTHLSRLRLHHHLPHPPTSFPHRSISSSNSSKHVHHYTTRSSSRFSRLPPRIQRLAAPLRAAPLSHITAFLVLHELTAVLPLGGLWWGIHATGVVSFQPSPESESDGVDGGGVVGKARRKWFEWVKRGEGKLGNYVCKTPTHTALHYTTLYS